MIDVLSRVSRWFGGTETDDSQSPISVDDLDDDFKRELAYYAQYRCADCSVPEFRVESLYFVRTEEGEDDPIPLCEECLHEHGRGDEADEEHRLPDPYIGQRGYLIDPDRVNEYRHKKRGDLEVEAIEETPGHDSDDKYAGTYPRRMAEMRGEHPRQHLWLGYTARGIRLTEVGVKFSHLFRHMFFTGATRRGKSTLTEFVLLQHAWAGFGFCCIDPHGDLVDDLKRKLPPKRRDDVIWIEPSPGEVDRIVGLNLLEVGVADDHPNYHDELKRTINGIIAVLKNEDYWGTKMGGIVENLLQGMILSDTQYTLVDLHSILLNQDRRKEFAAKIVDEGHWFVARYTKDIAEMDSDDLDALIRRVNKWIQYRVSREIVAHKESSVSIDQAVREGKIILVKNNVDRDIQQMIATTITGHISREIWRREKDDDTAPDRDPFFLCIDELDNVLTEEMQIPDLLADAGKYRLGMILMTQYPSKLPGEVVSAAKMNCQTFVSFSMPDPDEARPIASKYDCQPSRLVKLGAYQAMVRIEINRRVRGPFEIQTFPPYPPLRTTEEAREWIEQPSLDRYGVERLSDEDIWYDSLDEHGSAVDENTSGEGSEDEDQPLDLTDERLLAVTKAFLDEGAVQGHKHEKVRLETALPRAKSYHDAGEAIDYASLEGTLLNSIPTGGKDGYIERWEDDEKNIWVRTTATGRTDIFETGTAASSGGPNHDQLLRDGYVPLVQLGIRLDLLTQTGDAMADGNATLDVEKVRDVDFDDLSADEKRDMMDGFVEKHPSLARITLSADVVQRVESDTEQTPPLEQENLTLAVEAESATGDSKGGYTCLNGAQAANADRRCLYLARPDAAPKIWNTLTSPPYYSERGGGDNEQRCYNLGNLTIADEQMIRPAIQADKRDETVWIREETGEISLRDSEGTEHHRFEDAEAVFGGPRGYPKAIPKEADVPDGYKSVRTPFLPAKEFEDGIPDRDEWEIVIIPPDAEDADDLAVYRDNETIPINELAEYEQPAPSREDALEAIDGALGDNDD